MSGYNMRSNRLGFDRAGYAVAIQQELSKVPGSKMGDSKNTFILCPFPDHNESTASGKVNHDPSSPHLGAYWCFGCGKGASWKTIAELMRVNTLDGNEFASNKVQPLATTYYDLAFLGGDEEEEEVSADTQPEEQPVVDALLKVTGKSKLHRITPTLCKKLKMPDGWRGFSWNFLRDDVGASLLHDKYGRWLLYLPVIVDGERHGYIRARLEKEEGKASYLNKAGAWSSQFGLFPFDTAIRMCEQENLDTVVLVEGPRDALRLIRDGIPAMSILGTQSWSSTKEHILEFAGIANLILCFDGDNAGLRATYGTDTKDGILDRASDAFNVHVIKLWQVAKKLGLKKLDPGNAPEDVVESIRKLLYKVDAKFKTQHGSRHG